MTTGVVSPPLLADDRSLLEKLVEPLADLPPDQRAAAVDAFFAGLDPDEAAFLLSWEGQRRPSQTIDPRDDASLVCLMGGKGGGKTRGGAEGICDRIEADELRHGAFVSRTPGDVRRVMIEGPESGFKVCAERRGIEVHHEPSKAQIDIVDGGTITLYSAEVPDSLRGPEHDTLWGDEFAAWSQKKDEMGNTTFSNAMAGLRLGRNPLGIFTTTPKALPAIKDILTDTTGLWRVVRMTTWGNAAHLPPVYLATLRKLYGGTRLAAQEFEGLYVEDIEGALWSTEVIETTRVHLEANQTWRDVMGDTLIWKYVSVDPSVAKDGGGDECGITGGGVGLDRRFYVVGDWSGHLSPRDWAQRSVWAFHEIGAACIVAEGNQGGALVSEAIHNVDPTVPVEIVHASVSKRARAEPVAMLWQAEPGTHPMASLVGSFPELEGELTGWDANTTTSPNRLDSMVWLGHRCLGHLFEAQSSWSASAGNIRLPV